MGFYARIAVPAALILLLASCCSEDSNGNCSDGCLQESEQRSCTGGSPPASGTLRISHSNPGGWDSVTIELHHSTTVEGSSTYKVLRPKSGTESTEYVFDGDWSARVFYWHGGISDKVTDAGKISYGKSYGCTCYEYTSGTATLDLVWQ